MQSNIQPSWSHSDNVLLIIPFILMLIGILMVGSSSLDIAEKTTGSPWYYVYHQAIYIMIGCGAGLVGWRFKSEFWQRNARWWLWLSIFLLILVLVPGIGHRVNGAQRWLKLGFMNFQASEFLKFSLLIYFSDYIVRRGHEFRDSWIGIFKPLVVYVGIAVFLLLEPDYGTTVVVGGVVFTYLFMAGADIKRYSCMLLVGIGSLASLILLADYRLSRLLNFLNPWEHQYDHGYQLTQSLIAFGRGGWSGVGFGNSLQKMFYLPEAHTDFLFAIIGEEFGLWGCLFVFMLFLLLAFRTINWVRRCLRVNCLFHAYVILGFGCWILLQSLINISSNIGLLPTKGLTLPWISYGGSSMLMNCFMLGIVLRLTAEINVGTYASRREEV